MMRTAVSGTRWHRPKATGGTRLAHPDRHRGRRTPRGDSWTHTVYDTTSILQFLSKRFGLELLPGIRTQFGDLACIRFGG